MHLVVAHELRDKISQTIEFKKNTRAQIAAFYPYLLLYNSPNGTFKFSLVNSSERVIFSKTFDSNDIKNSLKTNSDFLHVYFPVINDLSLFLEKGIYTLVLESENYIYSNNSYLAWLQEFENFDLKDSDIEINELPLSYRVKEYREMSRVLDFADGFTASNPPNVVGGTVQEPFDVPNNANGFELIELDETKYSTIFFRYEITRKDIDNVYKCAGEFLVSFMDGAWQLFFHGFNGHKILSNELKGNNTIAIRISGDGTKLVADTGAMGAEHKTNVTLDITRIINA